jgi:hypothetical protein
LLCEDPLVPVLRGEDPIILDPYSLRILDQRFPGFSADLCERVRAKEFRSVVLVHSLKPAAPGEWHAVLLGEALLGAIRENYILEKQESTSGSTYFVFVPKRGPG